MTSLTHQGKKITEEVLLAGLLNNDLDCFSAIYDLYSGRLFGLILKWVKEKETAEIILQKAFVRVWHERELFEPAGETFHHWLCRKARLCYHECIAFGVR